MARANSLETNRLEYAMNSSTPQVPPLELPAVDLTQRSVRVARRRPNGFVEFEFSIGWPELMVELTMTEADFQAFCKAQNAQVL